MEETLKNPENEMKGNVSGKEENPDGDLNQDGIINVLDIILLVNIILQ